MDGFNKQQHDKLFNCLLECEDKQFNFLLSNADVEYVKETFKKFEIILCKRHINAKNPNSTANEVLIQSNRTFYFEINALC